MNITIKASTPNKLKNCQLEAFKKMVTKGGEVSANSALDRNIQNAKSLIQAFDRNKLVGVTALKKPQQSYREKICNKANVKICENEYPFELGYVYVSCGARGKRLSHCLVKKAIECADGKNIFATVRTDNESMLKTLKKAGFNQIGQDYCSDRDPGQKIQIHTFRTRPKTLVFLENCETALGAILGVGRKAFWFCR